AAPAAARCVRPPGGTPARAARRGIRSCRRHSPPAGPAPPPSGGPGVRPCCWNRQAPLAFPVEVAHIPYSKLSRRDAMARSPDATTTAAPDNGRTARARVKRDVKTLKTDLKAGAREEAERLRELAAEADSVVRERAAEAREKAQRYYDEARLRGREYYDDASERLDEYQRYLSERVQERPLQSTGIALGVGVI